ncbi:MAG: hypothetical protein QXW39_09860 [Candidatus Bathyarchaeia archaeon]
MEYDEETSKDVKAVFIAGLKLLADGAERGDYKITPRMLELMAEFYTLCAEQMDG